MGTMHKPNRNYFHLVIVVDDIDVIKVWSECSAKVVCRIAVMIFHVKDLLHLPSSTIGILLKVALLQLHHKYQNMTLAHI